MKKIIKLIFVIAGCLVWTSCSNNDFTEIESSVKVVSASTAISAAGGTGNIVVTSANPISAYASDNWLKVTTSGSKVDFSAIPNPNSESRNTTVVIKGGSDSTIVNVKQYGSIFKLDMSSTSLYSKDAGGKRAYKMFSNLPVTLNPGADWLTATSDNDSLYVTFAPNTTGKPRQTTLVYSYGETTDTLDVLQMDASYLNGDWKWDVYEYNLSTFDIIESVYDVKATVNATNDSVALAISYSDYTLNMKAAFKQGKLVFEGGQALTKVEATSFYYACPTAYKSGVVTTLSNISISAPYISSNGYTIYSFSDDGLWTDSFDGFAILNFESLADVANLNYKSLLNFWYYPTLYRVEN